MAAHEFVLNKNEIVELFVVIVYFDVACNRPARTRKPPIAAAWAGATT
jgi:hypothetical protein